ncbi:hypothetical protein ACU686_42805 [Yinghuangia aomiensis]
MAGTGDRETVYYRERSRALIAVPTVAPGSFVLLAAAGALLVGEFGLAWTSFGMGFLMTYPFWVLFIRPEGAARRPRPRRRELHVPAPHRVGDVAGISMRGLLTVELRDGRRIVCDGVRSERTWPSPKEFPEALAFTEEARRRWQATLVE